MRIELTPAELSLLLNMLPCNDATEANPEWQSLWKKCITAAERHDMKTLPTFTAKCPCGGTYRYAPVKSEGGHYYHTIINYYRCDGCNDMKRPTDLDLKKQQEDL